MLLARMKITLLSHLMLSTTTTMCRYSWCSHNWDLLEFVSSKIHTMLLVVFYSCSVC